MAFFDVVLQTGACLTPIGGSSDFVSRHVGVIRKHNDDDDKVTKIGKIRAYRIHVVQAAKQGVSLFEVCDDHSDELHRIHAALFEPGEYDFNEEVFQKFQPMDADCLVLDYVVIHPKWRGLKLGLLAVRKVIDLVGDGCGIVVGEMLPLSPHAPQILKVPATWVPVPETDEDFAAAKNKLRWHFRKMGFSRIGRTAYFGLSMARVAPTADDILKPKA